MLENGKNVLIEKPLTLNLKCSQELINLAKKKNLFLMEAVWSRFLPSYEFVMETIKNGVIGDVYHVSADFGVPMTGIERFSKKELGGGSILDIGIYAINIVEMAFGGETPTQIKAIGHLNEDGVDESVSAALKFKNGKTASISTHSKVKLPCEAQIVGTKGILKV
jgi:dihydrodiol dehydrogenase / D-xylose 1-dehydrogenase (NADP)